MTVGRVLTLGFGTFGGRKYLPTLGLGSAAEVVSDPVYTRIGVLRGASRQYGSLEGASATNGVLRGAVQANGVLTGLDS